MERVCKPQYATPRRPERATFGGDIAAAAKALGVPLMPWQRLVADVAGEIDPRTGRPAYGEIIVTVPRQSGKTTLYAGYMVSRCLSPRWTHPQRTIFTAQTGRDARDKWLDEIFPMLERSPLARFLDGPPRTGMGNEYAIFKNGSLLRLASSSKSAGHSKTLDLAVLDEIWHDADFSREQGLRPTMATRHDAQLLNCSTAGTDLSVVFNHKQKIGREAVLADSGKGIAYFEFSAPGGENWDPHDTESFYSFHPALCPDPDFEVNGCGCGKGEWRHTIGIEFLTRERQSMPLPEFMRAYGNVPSTQHEDREIPREMWEAVQTNDVPEEDFVFGLDIAEDHSSACIVVVGENRVVETLEYLPSVGAAVQRCKELYDKWEGLIVIDGSGPAAYLAKDLANEGVMVKALTASETSLACGRIYDAIADQKIAFSPRGDYGKKMTEAVDGLVGRPQGDRKVWSRVQSRSDIGPFMAATVAYSQVNDGALFGFAG